MNQALAVAAALCALSNAASWDFRPNLYFGMKYFDVGPNDQALFGLAWSARGGKKTRFAATDRDDDLRKWGFVESLGSVYGVQEIVEHDSSKLNVAHVASENGFSAKMDSKTTDGLLYLVLQTTGDCFLRLSVVESQDDACEWDDECVAKDDYDPPATDDVFVAYVCGDNEFVVKIHQSFENVLFLNEFSFPASLEVPRWAFRPDFGKSFPHGKSNGLVIALNLRQSVQVDVNFDPKKKFERALLEGRAEFDRVFGSAFPNVVGTKYENMCRAVVANSVGSVTKFRGRSIVAADATSEAAYEAETVELYTGVPSRSFFPRGFYWDEGFHALLFSRFLPKLAERVVDSWLERHDSDGWCAREQILGLEAERDVPKKFKTQHKNIANPPALMLAFDRESGGRLDLTQTRYRVLKKRFDWMRATQTHTTWVGKNSQHVLASGIDDYPRGPTGGFKHVDLAAWMRWFALKLAQACDDCEDKSELLEHAESYLYDMQQMYDSEAGFFFDKRNETHFEKHFGYVGLMPWALGVTNESLPSQLTDEKHLESPFGVRSLSVSDPLFGTKENYWRGAVWVNINYLLLTRTRNVELATKLADNVLKQYELSGFVYESYDSETGSGRGTKPFTGWTALVVLLINDLVLS